jgi:1-acyl-sn-glycerol-3-phosphate acyltransferase
MQAPIVPMAIDGFYDAWPRGKKFQKFARLQMTIGKPIFPPPESQASEDAYEKLTTQLKSKIVEMWEELRKEPDHPNQ